MKAFGPFRLDPQSECLWRDGQRILLTPKAFAILNLLVERPGALVTQAEILEQIWPNTYVQPEVIKTYIRDLRAVLGDPARSPSYIETRHRRGYRFLAPVSSDPRGDDGQRSRVERSNHSPASKDQLESLLECLRKACSGNQQLVFVRGEVGSGKTTLVNRLVERISTVSPKVVIGCGQCLEGFGSVEPYYPVLQALSSLLRDPEGTMVIESLIRLAPSWRKFPALGDRHGASVEHEHRAEDTARRMLREFFDAIETCTRDHPLLIILEDVHWADAHTIDWLAAFGRSGLSFQVMVIATYRPVELALSQRLLRTVKDRLLLRRQCVELSIPPLSVNEVAVWLAHMAPSGAVPRELAQFVHDHTEGNPLFMEYLTEYLVNKKIAFVDSGNWTTAGPLATESIEVPATLRQALNMHIDVSLSEADRSMLETASACGMEFNCHLLAHLLEVQAEDVEVRCVKLAETDHFVRALKPERLPDGSLTAAFRFVHSLFRQQLYSRLPLSRRLRLHQDSYSALKSMYMQDPERVEAVLQYHRKCARHLERRP